ncbi:CCAAT-binding factor [Actinidia rufa]|uniref:CCAAT-binding factor n=1 Tax=Actinidia rufa TaxID=165716 RepID=A0A7J0G0G4_9ERIC|nr:CCAAT-binding factor [Actinidia rufa]
MSDGGRWLEKMSNFASGHKQSMGWGASDGSSHCTGKKQQWRFQNPKKPEHGEDIDLLKSDVASFASSIGLSSSAPSSGFDDSDFRKTGPLKPRNKQHPPPNKSRKQPKSNDEAKTDLKKNQKNNNSKERPKPSVLQPLLANNSKGFDKFKNLPLLPLVKARSLGAWHMDAAELEKKVIGGDSKKKVELRDVEEWKRLVAKKKELAERLLAQYTQDYEASRGQSGDVKMLMATQRSGTATDKVSAFSVMVGENPIANLRSLDALLEETRQTNVKTQEGYWNLRGVQALMLLDKISSKNQIVSDRFYRALYSKLLLPAAMNSSKAKMFIGLVLRALKNDINLKRVSAFSKRLLQVALQQPPQYACGCLFLLSEVLKARPPLCNITLICQAHGPSGRIMPGKLFLLVIAFDTASDSSEDEDASPASDSESDASDEADDLLVRGALEGVKEAKSIVGRTGDQPQVSDIRTSLPGGNADHVSWWELKVLASHVHPSVATMARTLLSGANIVYNGNPLNDLSLPAFLDKLMEKKPKQSTWHGGSQIEPSKKLDMNNQLIGPEILSLAEMDVPPEDLVFHKFYMNKMSDDESDNEEIENMLDSANPSLEAGGDYDYDDLDQVAIEDDDDLVGNVSDEEIDVPSDIAEGEDDYDDANSNFTDDNDVDVGDADDGSEEEAVFEQRNRKRKSGLQTAASPFASLEEYEHLLDEQTPARSKSAKGKNSTSKKRRKKSKSISSSS